MRPSLPASRRLFPTFVRMSHTTLQQPKADREVAAKLGLLSEEYDRICILLEREPNFTELSIYSVMWSEHCSYKNSIMWLKTLPKDGPGVLAKAGEENAGLVDVGDGWACAFKIESHNHPSAVEPYQGAATGVGGINRDIFTMGARPVAILNSLRFGNPADARTQWLIKGIVKGIGDYGNAFGVPTVGGETFFAPCYQQNPLVNAMSVGLVKVGKTLSAVATGVGNPVFIVGSATGKDGIHGATFASADLTENSADDIPSVQVGDPFQEKLLLEATLELVETGAVVGMQDMGAAGITCSTSEMSAKGEHGMDVWLDKVPTRQANMQPFEILLSESQERMLVVVKKGEEEKVQAVFAKWDIHCAQIGVVKPGGTLRYFYHEELVAEVPAESLVLGGGAPVYERSFREPEYIKQSLAFDPTKVPVPSDLKQVAADLLMFPNLASKSWITEQYDSMVGTATLTTNLPNDAALINLKGTERALGMTVDCNPRYVHAHPETGTAIAVAEAARNLVCSGAKPLGVTNCLNFGNPYNPEVYWQFVGAIKGMSRACKAFHTPVTGGNVSFYNQYTEQGNTLPVFPTPTIGMVGLVHNKKNIKGLNFKTEGDCIILIGKASDDLCSSEYLNSWHNITQSPPPAFSLEDETALCTALEQALETLPISSVHDCSDGGLWLALLEKSLPSSLGFSIRLAPGFRPDGFFFGEAQGRVVISCPQNNSEEITAWFTKQGLENRILGEVTSGAIVVDGTSWGSLNEFRTIWKKGLAQYLPSEG